MREDNGVQFLNHLHLKSRPNAPRGEFLLADAVDLALGLLAAGYRQDLLENLLADVVDRRPFQHVAGVDVHVVDHVVDTSANWSPP